MPKPKMSIQDLSLKTVTHSKARHSFCAYTNLHPTQENLVVTPQKTRQIFAIQNNICRIDILAQLLQVHGD